MLKRILGIQSPTKTIERKWIGNMIIYISGPITGHKDYKRKFNSAERKLRRKGYKVVNPARMGEGLRDLSYEDIMEIDLKALAKCDAIYMLTGWWESQGAKAEIKEADALGLEIKYEDENGWRWLGEDATIRVDLQRAHEGIRYFPGRADNMMRDGI